jgi:cobyrinic acid a,c-diamide synthase
METLKFEIRNPKSAIRFAGVIFNRVASESHYKRLKGSVRDVPVLGYLPRDLNFEIPHRHLGLSIAEENPIAGENIDRLADAVIRHIDIDELTRYAGCLVSNPPFQGEGQGGDGSTGQVTVGRISTHPHPGPLPEGEGGKAEKIRLAVAYDKAFSFYYEDNLDLLQAAGAEIIRFSPLVDRTVPDNADALYIGGGYPELHALELSRNTSMLSSIRAWAEREERSMPNAEG